MDRNINKTLGIITARGGSLGIKKKNIIILKGKPLIYYTIKEAKKSKLITRLVCSTEDNEIKRIVESYGVEVITRPKEFAKDDSPIEEALKYTISYLKEKENYYPEQFVLLYANIPIRDNNIIDNAISELNNSKNYYDAVISVIPVGKNNPFWMLKLNNANEIEPYKKKYTYRRQDLPDLYIHDGAVIVSKTNSFLKSCNKKRKKLYDIFGRKIKAIIQNPLDSIDVDTKEDLIFAEFLLKMKKKKS